MKSLEYSFLVILTVFASLLFAYPSESQTDVETISEAPIERPPLSKSKYSIETVNLF